MSVGLNYFLDYQREWIRDEQPTSIAEKSRRVGLTHAHAYRSVERRVRLGTDEYFASRDKESAGIYIDDVKLFSRLAGVVAEDLGEQIIDEKKNLTAFVVRIRHPQSGRLAKVMALSSNPDAFRGKGGDITLDEFAFHPDPRAVLKSANASAKVWGHQVRIISTHNGEGNLFNLLVRGIAAGQRKIGHHKITILDAVRQGLYEKVKRLAAVAGEPTARQREARQAWLDELRESCIDQAEWDEEYLCIPGSEANALLTYDLIGACERGNDDLPVVEDPRELKFNGPMYAGMDVGRRRDLTVFWVLGKVGDVFETRLVKSFENARYQVQEDYLNLLLANPQIKRICIDRTGIGDMLAERAEDRHGAYRAEGVHFTAPVKSELAMPLKRLFEDRLIRIPAEAAIREGLHKVRKITTAAGNVRLDARHDEDGHADEFWSLALAYHAADDLKLPLPAPLAQKPMGW